MKKILSVVLFVLAHLNSYGQLQGTFNYAQDGHIYFYLSNPTGYQVPVVWGVYNFDKNQQRQNQGVMAPYSTFTFGPNFNWVWEKGEKFAVTYANGQTVHWTCPQTDPAIAQRQNPTFKGGRKCTYPIGASTCSKLGYCSGFQEGRTITTCKHCPHDSSWHK